MDNSEVFTYMEGKIVDLAPINSEHIKIYARWINNPKIRRFIFNRLPSTTEDIKNGLNLQKRDYETILHLKFGIKLIKNQ